MVPSDTQGAIRDTIRAFAQEKLAPRSLAFERERGYPEGLFEEMGELGLVGMIAPAEYGGAAAEFTAYILGLVEIAAADGALSTIVSIQNSMMVEGALAFGSDHHNARYLSAYTRFTKERPTSSAWSSPERCDGPTSRYE